MVENEHSSLQVSWRKPSGVLESFLVSNPLIFFNDVHPSFSLDSCPIGKDGIDFSWCPAKREVSFFCLRSSLNRFIFQGLITGIGCTGNTSCSFKVSTTTT